MVLRELVVLMDSDSWLSFILLIGLILGGGYFAGAETAFASANKIRLKNYADNGDPRAKKAMHILNNFDKALTTLLIGNNIVHIACASLATLLATKLWGVSAVAYSTIAVTIVVFLFGEMLPKAYASGNAETVALAASGSLHFLIRIVTPVAYIFTSVSRLVSKLFVSKQEPAVTEDELYDIIETIKEEGSLEEGKSQLIHSALEFADITVQNIITSRVDLVALDIEMTWEEILQVIKKHKYSRLPVYEDTIDNIIGVLGIRKYLKNYIKYGDKVSLADLLDEPHFVHKTMRIDDLLKEMSGKKFHVAVVTDDYGGTLGIVTVEDILEELVGDIWDEDDEVVEEFRSVDATHFEVGSDMPVVDAFEAIGFDKFDRDAFGHKTMGAWALENFDFIPKAGSRFSYENLSVSVLGVKHRRITKLMVEIMPEGREAEEKPARE